MQEKAEHRRDEMMAELNRNITRLQDEVLKEGEKARILHQVDQITHYRLPLKWLKTFP